LSFVLVVGGDKAVGVGVVAGAEKGGDQAFVGLPGLEPGTTD
jgi:hypothetical protein